MFYVDPLESKEGRSSDTLTSILIEWGVVKWDGLNNPQSKPKLMHTQQRKVDNVDNVDISLRMRSRRSRAPWWDVMRRETWRVRDSALRLCSSRFNEFNECKAPSVVQQLLPALRVFSAGCCNRLPRADRLHLSTGNLRCRQLTCAVFPPFILYPFVIGSCRHLLAACSCL